MRPKVRLLRIERRMTGEPAIATFIAWATDEELWQLTPAIAAILPEQLKADYTLIGSDHGLRVLYDRPGFNSNFRPMLDGLFTRWQLMEPTRVAEVIDECTRFLRQQRASRP